MEGGGYSLIFHFSGDYGRLMRIASLFAKDGEPQHLAPQLSVKDRGYLANLWGLCALALGDLRSAEYCFDLSVEIDRDGVWENLIVSLRNRAYLAMARGAFPSAREFLIESLEYPKAGDAYLRSGSHSSLAATFHALGEISKAKRSFAVASGPLTSYGGVYEAEHLLDLGDKNSALKRTKVMLTRDSYPREKSLYYMMLGLLSLPDSITEARGHLEKALGWTERSGHMECIVRAHILAGEIAFCAGDFPGALAEATIGLNHAESCGFGRFATDLLLLLARIRGAIPDPRAALKNARAALERSQHPECRYAWGEANALHICGVCHKELGEMELAIKRLTAAYEVRKRIQHPEAEETGKILAEMEKGK